MNERNISCTLCAVGLFIAGFGIGVVLVQGSAGNLVESLFGTFIGAVGSAVLIFYFQNKRESGLALNEEVRLARALEDALYSQHRLLQSTVKNYLEEFRSDSDRHIKMLAPLEIETASFRIDKNTFVIFDSDDRYLLVSKIRTAEHNFYSSFQVLHNRLSYYANNIAGSSDSLAISRHGSTLMQSTNNVYNSFDNACAQYGDLRLRIYETLIEKYPNHTFLNPEDTEFTKPNTEPS